MYNDYPEVTKEEMLDLLDTEMFKQAYEERVFMGVCDRKTRLFYPDHFYGITQIDTPLPMAHMLAEEYMSRPYEDVDWARLTNFYDLNDMNMIAYLLYTKLVWKTPAEFTLLKDRFVIDGRIAVEVKDENYKWLDKLYEWQRKIEEEAILYFADNLPVWNEDTGDGDDYYCMEGMIEWNRITSSCIYLGKEFFPKINYLSSSAFRDNIKLIAKKRGGTKAAEIIRKFQEDWPDIVHWGCFGIHTISDKEVKYFQKSLFEGFNRELRKWESDIHVNIQPPQPIISPNNEQTQSQTGNSVYEHCTFNTTNNYYGAQSSAPDNAEDVSPSDDFSSNCSDCQSESRNQRGPRTQYLFSDARGNEDTQRAATEAERVRKYIADHKMGQYQLDSKTSSKLNLMVACFWYRWYELDMVDEEPQGAAIYRFFTNQCGLECSVMPKAFATVICKIINSGKKDPEIYDNLYSYFPELNKNNRN